VRHSALRLPGLEFEWYGDLRCLEISILLVLWDDLGVGGVREQG
jgi:hypothetical protein